ncbi:unnamed protein product [Withania somnifera]
MDEKSSTMKEKRVVFVTAGTTCFDALVRAVDTPEVKSELFKKGYTNILIQIGRGSYIPTKSTAGNGSTVLEYFTFSGSGSIFETLRLGKPLIVVVNEDLMDNHQSELAEELAERTFTIANMDTGSLIPYLPGDAETVARLISRYLGFPDD